MRKKLPVGLSMVLFLFAVLVNSVFAGHNHGGGSGGNPPVVPEPISCLLFLASGATYAGIRYLRARRKSKDLEKRHG